tara:strand:- start:14 stop:2146 length:2133 start_codon:yes stop_codon:yes gene_type:complete
MPGRTDIDPQSITDGKISNQAKISHSKIAPAVEGQILVAQSNGKFSARSLSGDVTIKADGSATSTASVVVSGEATVVQGPAGPAGPAGPIGPQGNQGESGPAGGDATVTTSAVDTAGAVMHTDLGSDGFIKRNGLGTYTIDSNSYEQSFSKNTAFNKDFGTATGDVCEGDDSRLSDARTPTSHTHTLTDVTDSGGAAALDVGTATGTVCAGDDGRLSDARTPSSHTHDLSDITDSGGAAALDVGTATGTVCAGDDSRLTDSRTPTSHNHTLADVTDSGGAAALDIGTTAGTVCAGDDSRLSDARTPTTHSHSDATGSAAGFMPSADKTKLDGVESGAEVNVSPDWDASTGDAAISNKPTLGDSASKDVGTASDEVAQGNHTHAHSDLTGISNLQHIDWTATSPTPIHASNYTDTTANETITLSGDVSGSGTTAITCTVDDDSHSHTIGTITGVLDTSAGAGSAGKLIKLDAAGHIDSTMINDGDISFVDLDDIPSTFAPSAHNHTLSEVTDSGTAAPLDVPASGNATTGQVVKGNDTRLSDARTPSAHNHAATDITSGTLDTDRLDVGASAGKVAAGDHAHSQYSTFDIDDSSALTTDVWSASKIISYLASFYATLANGFAPHKYTAAIEWETEVSTVGFTGTSGSMVCTLNHGLNTKYVFIAVRDKDDASEDIGYVALTTVIDANNVKLEYSVSDYPDVGEDKFITIIG